MVRLHLVPLSRRPQNNVVALIAGDDPIKLLKLFGLACRDAQFFHFKCARVANHIPFYFRLGVLTCEAYSASAGGGKSSTS